VAGRTPHPEFHLLNALPLERVQSGLIKECDHCGEQQLYGNSFRLEIGWRMFEICRPCAHGLVKSAAENYRGLTE